jgi:hypothetical protein
MAEKQKYSDESELNGNSAPTQFSLLKKTGASLRRTGKNRFASAP